MQPIYVALIGIVGTIIGAIITVISNKKIAENQRVNNFRLAALDKRLEVHQEAYKLWSELFFSLNSEKVHDKAYKCQEWWYENCLYLDPKTRKAFKKALLDAQLYNQTDRNNDKDLKEKLFKEVEKVGELIVKGVELPTIGEYESKSIKDINK
ncbi:MAG: hypothetical protein PWR10_1754 [Halanaerobiales bacterium]|nr:hypothetical protein [Halanaerobiales bacterium]